VNWTDLLRSEIESTYKATEGLLDFVDERNLGWKPATGTNWMTTGQLLHHLPEACGLLCRGFVTGVWPMPEGMTPADMKPEEMLPPAEAMATATSVAAVREALEKDKQVALDMVFEAGEENLANQDTFAPWDPDHPMKLGQRLLHMVGHLSQHKAQLFYYLKLQGKPVNTWNLYG
jgi:hypothetical protein